MQVKKKSRNAATKKIQKAPPKEKRTKKERTEQPLLKRVIFGEERPDLTELEAGSTTILDILAPTTVDTKSKDYIVVDGVYHTYLYITGYPDRKRLCEVKSILRQAHPAGDGRHS